MDRKSARQRLWMLSFLINSKSFQFSLPTAPAYLMIRIEPQRKHYYFSEVGFFVVTTCRIHHFTYKVPRLDTAFLAFDTEILVSNTEFIVFTHAVLLLGRLCVIYMYGKINSFQ